MSQVPRNHALDGEQAVSYRMNRRKLGRMACTAAVLTAATFVLLPTAEARGEKFQVITHNSIGGRIGRPYVAIYRARTNKLLNAGAFPHHGGPTAYVQKGTVLRVEVELTDRWGRTHARAYRFKVKNKPENVFIRFNRRAGRVYFTHNQ